MVPGRDATDKFSLMNILNEPEKIEDYLAAEHVKYTSWVGFMFDQGLRAMQKGSIFADCRAAETPHQMMEWIFNFMHRTLRHPAPHVPVNMLSLIHI